MGKGKKRKQSDLRLAIERERTGSQIYGAASYGYYINSPYPNEVIDKRKLELMRRYPTITYLTQLITIAGDSAEWTVEADEGVPWEAVNLIQRFIDSCKLELWRTAIDGWISFGHAAYEKVYQVMENESGHPRLVISQLKNLLADTYMIERDSERGFLGIRTFIPRTEWLNPYKCLILSHDKLGDDLNGRSLLKNAELTFDAAAQTWQNMQLYNRKAANGPKYKIMYPDMVIQGANGERIRTIDKAREMAVNLENTGVALLSRRPNTAGGQLSATDSDWDIERFPNEAMSSAFIEELMYQDKCLCRAFGIPERSVIEGMFSTRADAANASEFTLLRIQYLVKHVVDQLNRYVVNPLMELNYDGLSGRVRLQPGDIDRSTIEVIRQFVMSAVAGDEALKMKLDYDAMLDRCKIPRLQENENKQKLEQPLYEKEQESAYRPLSGSYESLVRNSTGMILTGRKSYGKK